MYQKLTIVGNLGSDTDLRYTPSGQAVCNFSVATNRRWTDREGQQQEETTWFRVSTWGKLAEVCNQYLNKGKQVFIEGRLRQPRAWQAQDGEWRASLEVTALEVKFLGNRGDTGGFDPGRGASVGGAAPSVSAGSPGPPAIVEDEIPF